MWADPAVALVCAYLRVNGYFTLTEFEVSVATRHGYRSLTDLDIIAVRLPTTVPSGNTSEREPCVESGIIATIDPVLDIDESRIDALFVEVKQGHAEFNPALRNPLVLEAGLRRIGGDLGAPVAAAAAYLAKRGGYRGGELQVRLLAVGSHGTVRHGTTLTHDHLLGFIDHHVVENADALKVTAIGDPVVGFVELVHKAGMTLPR